MKVNTFFVTLLVLCSALVLVVGVSSKEVPIVTQINLDQLPMQIGLFHGQDDRFPDSVYDELNADYHIYRHYSSDTGQQIDLYIGYYGTAKGGRSSHNPYACLPGGGWGILDTENISIEKQASKENLSVNYVLAKKDEVYTTMIHWYQTAGSKIIANGIQQNIERFFGRILHNRNDGAYVQISVYSGHNDLNESRRLAETFAEKVIDMLPAYWPLEE